MILLAAICVSFHLKIKTPSGFSTRIHSSNPCFRSVSHVDNKMRGIKHNKAKRCILKGHISEVANHIRMYF